MKTFSSVALATLVASVAGAPALITRQKQIGPNPDDNEFKGTPGGLVKLGNGPPVCASYSHVTAVFAG
jgi:hypothetical protein